MVNVGRLPDGSPSPNTDSAYLCVAPDGGRVISERPTRPRSNPIQLHRVSDTNVASVRVFDPDTATSGRPSSTPPGQWLLNHAPSNIHFTASASGDRVHKTPLSREADFNVLLDSDIIEEAQPAGSISNGSLATDLASPSTRTDVWVTSSATELTVSCENLTTCVTAPTVPSDNSFLFPTSSLSPPTPSAAIDKFGIRATPIRTKLKRPHSAISGDTNPIQLEETTERPFSAPKRLVGEVCDPISELFVDGSTLSFTTLDSATLVAEGSDVNGAYPPKSTLEALVASNSPLLFFPTGYSLDTDQDAVPLCDFLSASSAKSRSSPVDSYEAGENNYTMDPESNNPDYMVTDVGSDILNGNSANSVSSSKSLASVDLCETVPKSSDSQGSPNTTLSEFGVSSKTYLDAPGSITTHLSAFVEAMRSYAAELCPVDCVILMERCRPFNCDTLFMKYFREQYLCPILSNLNGGPPLNADFGRDAYTSLYSLHGFYWRKPRQINTWVPDTPIIYRILKQIATVKHEERHATNEHADMFTGTPGHDLLEAAVEAFDAIDRARRGLCKQVQRHLILLTVSPINLAEVHKELVSSSDDCTKSGPLTNLRRRGVALSAFAPVPSATVLQLYEIINGTPPSPFYDRHWQTVALSPKLMDSDSPERRIIGPLAADAHAQAEAELLLTEQRHQKKLMQDQPQIDPVLTNGHAHSLVGPLQGSSPSSPARYVSKMQRHSSQATANYMEGYMNGQTATINSGVATAVGCSASDNAYRGTPNKLGPVVPPGNNSLSPMVQPYPGPANESPISHGHRSLRTSSHGHGSTPPGPTSRTSVPRSIADVIRPSEQPQVTVSCSSLSAGHSGPNSVDQLGPGSAYGSDSVATPQGFSAGIMSPQQSYNSGAAISTQLYSPASSTLANLGQSQSAAGSNVSYQPYQQLPPEGSNSQMNLRQSTAMAQSPGSVQGTFRPPSNAASPVGQLVSYANTVGLSSPSASRGPTRQYSPQLPPQSQQPAPHQRHTSPHSGGPPHQSARSYQLASPDNGLPGARSRSLTPIHFPPGGPPAQSIPNAYQMKENIPISSGPGSTGMWLSGHPPSHAMGGNTARPYDSQTYRPGLPSSCSGYQTSVNSGRSSIGTSAGVPGGPGMHRDPNSLTASGRPDSGPHQLSQSIQRPQSSALEAQAPVSHSVLWEGEVHVNDPNFSGPSRLKMSLILEQAGLRDFSQFNMQLWGPVAQLSIILAHCDSALVHRLTNNSPGGNLLGQVLVELPQSEEACNLVSALSSSISSMAVPLGILSPPPNMLPSPIPSGTIGFVCLSYSLKRNHIYGLIPADSEQFRQDLPSRQSNFTKSGASGVVVGPPEGSGPAQRSYAPAVSRVDDQFLSRSGIPTQSSFVTPNTGSMYVSVQRPMGPMSAGDRSTQNALPGQVYPNQPHLNYQSAVSTAQIPSSASYMSTTGFSAKNQLSFMPMQQQQQTTLQRNTPSPSHRQREMMHSQSGADPQPPQWMASQGEMSHHSQGREGKPALQQQQQLYAQRPQIHAKPTQSYAFQPQPLVPSDRFVQGSGSTVPISNVMSQPGMANESVGMIDHRNSPQFGVSTHQSQQRFLTNAAFQGASMVQSNYPLSGPAGSSSVPPSYGGQPCSQRALFPGQVPSSYQPVSSSNSSAVGYPQSGPGCYASRGGVSMPQSATAVSSYRFAPEHMINGGSNNNNNSSVGFMQMQSVHTGNHSLDPKPHHHPSSMDGQTYQTMSSRSMSCNIIPVDSTMSANSAQTLQQTGGHFSTMPTQEPTIQQAPSSMYGSMHPQQHSTYDAFGPSGFF
ncbi:hypothetical protein CRM22_002412 [Opisthorchis felineus]|uniref:Mediator of RNA polymerase II transcription subunit 25 von Willebrand factor type A domain-containing protein n=1 Tax=Opisthorchis felineus TaxID=147828 RepID=A0A4S2M674_OPIFE|nr:hypothetical protein CRM22_002412 [Opisthorchis felineus]